MHVSEQTLTPSYVVRYWSLSSRPHRPPLVFTLTIRVAPYVYKLDDGSEQVVNKHDVVFDFNILVCHGLASMKLWQNISKWG